MKKTQNITGTMRFLDNTQTIPNDSTSAGLQVLAAGQWRCATSSLQLAFETILSPPLAPSMHGAYLMPRPDLIASLNQATSEPKKSKRQKFLRSIYTGYNASSDWPGFVFLEDLLDLYPNCKIILNKRAGGAQSWRESCMSSLHFFSTKRYHFITYWLPICHHHHRLYTEFAKLAKVRYGVDDMFSVECYERHEAWVKDVCRRRGKEVLEWEPDDGWEPLCRFIGREVPKVEFPRTNDAEDIERLKVVLVKQGIVAWVKVLAVCALAVGLIWGFWR